MICPDCVKGMVVELRTKGQVHPYRETSILTYPEKYIKMGSKKTNNFNLVNIRTPFQIQ